MDFTALANPEETFFQHGYADGYAHGRIHGLIEGCAAGKEKGMTLWEEVGYYRGFAILLRAAYNDGSSRASHHITSLLSAIDRFPAENPKPKTDQSQSDQLDVSRLLSQIRSRHKALSSVLSVSLRLRSVATGQEPPPSIGLTPESYIQAIMTAPSKSATVWPIERDSTLGL